MHVSLKYFWKDLQHCFSYLELRRLWRRGMGRWQEAGMFIVILSLGLLLHSYSPPWRPWTGWRSERGPRPRPPPGGECSGWRSSSSARAPGNCDDLLQVLYHDSLCTVLYCTVQYCALYGKECAMLTTDYWPPSYVIQGPCNVVVSSSCWHCQCCHCCC